jgi:hypothetical protein
MPSVADLAKEMGIDLATVDHRFVVKLDEHYQGSQNAYSAAERLKKDAEANLVKVQQEQQEINGYIERYGATEAAMAALKANNAAMEASLKTLKSQGFNVDIPAAPVVPGSPAIGGNAPGFDPDKFSSRVGNIMAESFNANNRYMALFGKPIPDDMDNLAGEAARARMSLSQFVAQKYDFAGEERKRSEATAKAHDEEVAAKAVKKFQEEHPVTAGNPELTNGVPSRNFTMYKPRDNAEMKSFAGLSARDKIAQSVSRTRQLLTANQE